MMKLHQVSQGDILTPQHIVAAEGTDEDVCYAWLAMFEEVNGHGYDAILTKLDESIQ